MTGKRPRIKKGMPIVVKDELEFVKNKSSEKAQKAEEFDERIKIITWFDKHYLDRLQFGDENGKRAGIEKEQVIKLVRDAIKHLVYYSFKVKGFAFIDDDAPLGKHLRIILQREDSAGNMLNVIIEIHFVNLEEYEVTIITAMKVNDFFTVDGQYIIELYDDNGSSLKRRERGKLTEIYKY